VVSGLITEKDREAAGPRERKALLAARGSVRNVVSILKIVGFDDVQSADSESDNLSGLREREWYF